MWSAFGNGAGVHHGGGGYVTKAPGWEFVPLCRLDQESGRGRGRTPVRTLSSPAAVAHFYEEPRPGLGAASESASRAQGDGHDVQTQYCRLKRKCEELKKRHDQQRAEWLRDKELLLRQVADIQGGENRRILLGLKSVLEDVQSELRKEEAKRAELQLQYTKDRCTWELERAELKCRIVQLEAKGNKYYCDKTSPDPKETLKREREEQKRLLADTHTAAMDLRKQLEHSERGWVREKVELLERFDSERKEWESQLKDMQMKIEELYHEVKARREGSVNGKEHGSHDEVLRLALHSSSSESSVLGGLADQKLDCPKESAAKVEEILQCNIGQALNSISMSEGNEPYTNPFNNFQNNNGFPSNVTRGNEKKKYTSALNAALKEIAKVSEELCSYQDEIKKKSTHGRSRTSSISFLEEFEEAHNVKNRGHPGFQSRSGEPALSSEWSDEFSITEEENRINWSSMSRDLNGSIESETDTGAKLSPRKKEAPPIPPRTTSWYITGSAVPETAELPAVEINKSRELQEAFSESKCNSPSVLKKFGAMLHENEGKTLTDSGVFTHIVPADSKCNIGCCHSRWSCDGSKFGDGNSSTYMPVQKSFSDVNIMSFDTDSESGSFDNPKYPNGKFQTADRDITKQCNPSSSSAEIGYSTSATPTYIEMNRPKKNETLAEKTAEFNRTLFQAETGNVFEEENAELAEVCANSIPNGLNVNYSMDTKHFNPDHKVSAYMEYAPNSTRNNARLVTRGIKNACSVWAGNDNGQQVLNEHLWRPSNLASCPPPTDARSNYRVVEKILQGYENSVPSHWNSNCGFYPQQHHNSGSQQGHPDNLIELLDMLQIEQDSHTSQRLCEIPFRQTTTHRDIQLNIHKGNLDCPPVSTKKSFARPARPAHRRPPSRWATRSTSASTARSLASHIRTYSYSCHSDTDII
ncbi:uncharacterized protein KIAA0408 isoform X1 [Amia ocellicauda]|uniref:uncharacterized protein KIAA0408 isoform X1 n=1 Tax=Amia ocellicauda TaxID=2972642 RepID=UPI003464C2CC